MIDTVRLLFDGGGLEVPPGWGFSETSRKGWDADGLPEDGTTVLAEDPSTGMRIGGKDLRFTNWAEVSLPKLVHGRNSVVLRESEVQPAIARFVQVLAGCHDLFSVKHVTRVDVVGQFAGNPGEWIPAHRLAKHPRIRKPVCEWFGQSLHWPGKEIHGRLYDKAKEEGRGEGRVMRMEWQLRGAAMRGLFGHPKSPVDLERVTGRRCYSALRELTLPLQPAPLYRVGSIYDLLALGEREGWRDSAGRTCTEIFLAARSLRTARRARQHVSSARPGQWSIDWDELLPEEIALSPIIYDAQAA